MLARRTTRHSPLTTPLPRCAFTLLELVMVIAITAILLGVTAVRLSRESVFMAEGERVARTLVGDLRYTQSEAIARATNHYVLFTDGSSKYTQYALYRVDAGGDVQIEPARVLADAVAVTGNELRAEFSPLGDALKKYEYTVTAPGLEYKITVNETSGTVFLEEK